MKSKASNIWELVKLDEVTDKIFSGGTPKTKEPKYWHGQLNWMSSGETRADYIYMTEKKITAEGVEESSTKKALTNDVVMASAGQGFTRGQVSFLCVDTYINQSLIALRVNKKKLDSKFLYFNLKSRYSELRGISDGHSIRGSITTKMLKNLEIQLPPLEEQKAIAEILSALDDKIELNNKINENLEQQAQALFKHWFIDFEFPNEDGKPYKSSGGEMVESELGLIPKGWEVKQLGSLVERIDNRGKTPPYEKNKTDFPLLDVATLRGNHRLIDYNKVTKFVSKEVYENWFRNGHPVEKDILISTVGSLAEMKFFLGDKGCIAQNVVALRPKSVSSHYLYEYLINIRNELKSYDIGTVQPSIKVTHIINHDILLPEKSTLNRFHVIVEEFTKKIYLNRSEIEILTKLRDGLLPKLMSGEIRIPMES